MSLAMTRRRYFLSSIALPVLAIMSSVSASSAAPILKLVKVARPSATGFEFSFLEIGEAKGIFAKNGIKIQIFDLPGSKDQQALAAGDVDIVLGAGPELALIAKGSPVKAVAAMAGAPLNMGLIVRAHSTLKPKEFKGRTIGVTATHSLTDWLAMEFSKQQGWGEHGIRRVALGSPDGMIAALRAKNVDGIVASTETGYRLQERGQAKVLLSFGSRIHDFLTHIIFANDAFMKKSPGALRGFLKAWFETVDFIKQHKGEAIKISRKTTKLSQAMADRIYDEQMPMYYVDGHFPKKNLQGMKQALLDMGAFVKAPPDGKLIDERFLPAK